MRAAVPKLPQIRSVPNVASLPGHRSWLGIVVASKPLCRRCLRAASVAPLCQSQHSDEEGQPDRGVDEEWSQCLASLLHSKPGEKGCEMGGLVPGRGTFHLPSLSQWPALCPYPAPATVTPPGPPPSMEDCKQCSFAPIWRHPSGPAPAPHLVPTGGVS